MISSWGRANICVDFRTVFWHKCGNPHSAWERMKQAVQVDSRDGVGRAALLRRVALSAGLTLLAMAALAAIFAISRGIAVERVRESAQATLGSRVQAIESVLEKQRAVATVLASDELVRRAVADPDSHHREVSRKLERLQQETRSAVIYLVDAGGLAFSASNWNQPDSFVGNDYGFRDYFSQALRQGEATQFALGTVSHRPGLYLSHDVQPLGGDVAAGVIVVKFEFDDLEENWARSDARDRQVTYVADGTGQVVLTYRDAMRFRSEPVPDGGLIPVSVPVPGIDWRMVQLVPMRLADQNAALVTGTAGFGLTLLAGAAGWGLRARRRSARRAAQEARYRADLEAAVADRTRALSDEMRERRAAEQRLTNLQSEMEQANRLATLGQITAGVAHEVNQPLMTIRLLAENARDMAGGTVTQPLRDNLARILRMTDRIGQITTELRGFARKPTGTVGPVVLRDALEAALLLTASGRRGDGMRLVLPDIPDDLTVQAETVRLEQVLVNLIRNAQEALADHPDPEIRIDLTLGGDSLRLSVCDNGPGLSPEMAQQLFTPFTTSKPEGLGLGLVISEEIARSFGGRLWAMPPQPGEGAIFHLELPRVR